MEIGKVTTAYYATVWHEPIDWASDKFEVEAVEDMEPEPVAEAFAASSVPVVSEWRSMTVSRSSAERPLLLLGVTSRDLFSQPLHIPS